jgi:hypothetical protein
VAVPDGSVKWIRATLDIDNGAAGNDVKFYTSGDGQTWAQLGTTVTTAGVTSIFGGNASLIVGSIFSGSTQNLVGNIQYVEIRRDIDGTVVAALDLQKLPWVVGATSGASNVDRVGRTWTLNGAGAIIQRAYASDLDIRVRVTLVDLDNGGVKQGFVSSKQGTPTGFGLGMNTAGAIELAWGNGGISFFIGAGVGGFMVDGDTKWLRATLDIDDGAGNRVIRFYWSDNGMLLWTLFATVTTPGPTLIGDSPNSIIIGANGTTFQTMNGIIYYVDVRNGIDGTRLIDFNPAAPPWQTGDTSPTARPDQFGNIFTLAGVARIIGPYGNCDFVLNMCGGGYAGAAYNTFTYAGAVPCSGQNYPVVPIESNVEDFCILSVDCS